MVRFYTEKLLGTIRVPVYDTEKRYRAVDSHKDLKMYEEYGQHCCRIVGLKLLALNFRSLCPEDMASGQTILDFNRGGFYS
jgi:hypothetical protein